MKWRFHYKAGEAIVKGDSLPKSLEAIPIQMRFAVNVKGLIEGGLCVCVCVCFVRELNREGLKKNYSKEAACLGDTNARKYSVMMLIFALILNYLEQKVTLTKKNL